MKLSSSHTHNFLMNYAGVAAVGVLIAAAVGWGLSPTFSPAPLPAAKPVYVAVAPAHHAPTVPARARSASATVAPMPTVALGPVELPAQPEPVGLRQGEALRSIASSPAPVDHGDQPDWTALAAIAEPSPTASWSTSIPKALRAIAPSSGLLQTQITAYLRIATAGPHVFILSGSSGPVRAILTLDGQAVPLAEITRVCGVFGGCPQASSTGAGGATLAVGLHVVTITAQTLVGAQAGTLNVYERGPAAAMPTAIVPWAVPAGGGGNTTTVAR